MFMRVTSMSLFLAGTSWSSTHAETSPAQHRGPQDTRLSQGIVSVPMDTWGGRPVGQTKINGQGPFNLLLDTGTSFAVVLDDDLIKKLEIPSAGDVAAPGAVDEDNPVEIATITIGDAEFSKVQARRADFGGFMPGGADPIYGILGLPLFESCLLTLDYPGGKVRFESGELSSAGGDTMPYSPDQERDFGITIEVLVAGEPVRTHLDTGSPAFLTFLNRMGKKLPLKGEPRVVGIARTPEGEVEVRMARLDGVVKIGAHEFIKPQIDFADLGPMVEYDSGNVGYRLLEDFAITIDQKNRRLRLRRAGSDARPTIGPPERENG